MPKIYKTGTKEDVLHNMAYYAILYHKGFIESMIPQKPLEPHEDDKKAIQNSRDFIEDFKRFLKD